MSFLGSWKIDAALTFHAITHAATGALTDADAVPSYRVYEDETGTPLLTGSMAKLDDANTTGFYSEQITLSAANGFEFGKSYSIYITAAVGGVTAGVVHTFQIGAAVDVTHWQGTTASASATAGTPSVDVVRLAGGSAAATSLGRFYGAGGNSALTADSGTTTTVTDAALPGADDDYYKGDMIVFSSGTLQGQSRLITGYNAATKTITFWPPTTQAVSTHTYTIVPFAATWADLRSVLGDTGAAHLDAGRLGVSATATLDTGLINNAVWNGLKTSHVDTGTFGEHLGGALGGSASVDTGQVNNAIWNGLRADHAVSGSFGERVRADITSVFGDTGGVGGDTNTAFIKADVFRIFGSANAAFNLEEFYNDSFQQVDGNSTASVWTTTTCSNAELIAAANDHYKGMTLTIVSGTYKGLSRLIVGFNAATDTLTLFPPLPGVPATTVDFTISPAVAAIGDLGMIGTDTGAAIHLKQAAAAGPNLLVDIRAVLGDTGAAHIYSGRFGTASDVVAVRGDTGEAMHLRQFTANLSAGAYIDTGTIDGAAGIRANATHFGGTAGQFSIAGRPAVNTTHLGGSQNVVTNMQRVFGTTDFPLNYDTGLPGWVVSGGVGSVLDEILDGMKMSHHFRLYTAVLGGKLSGAGSGTEIFTDHQNSARVTATVDASGNRSAVALNLDTT